jgi:hypothetical protein
MKSIDTSKREPRIAIHEVAPRDGLQMEPADFEQIRARALARDAAPGA